LRSVEPSSTTITSSSCNDCLSTDSRHSVRYVSVLNTGIITVTNGYRCFSCTKGKLLIDRITGEARETTRIRRWLLYYVLDEPSDQARWRARIARINNFPKRKG